MDGFGDNFVPNGESPAVAAVDPAADFLAREQDELAGLDDPPAPVADTESEDLPQPELPEPSSTSSLDSPSHDDPLSGAATNGVAAPVIKLEEPAAQQTPERAVTPTPRVDPEAIRVWREEHQQKLIEKDAAEEEAKEALREKAKQELADWYKQHDEQVSKTRQANRCAEKELVADTERPEPGTEWERIAKLCDFNPKTAKSSRDVSRMRSIILHVKQSPPVKA